MNDSAPQTPAEALTLALTLAITAPDDDKTAELIQLADQIASQLTASEVEACQAAAKVAAGL